MGLTRSIVSDSDAEILAALVAADGSSGGFLKDSDYSVGTWTPVLTFATAGDLAVTYAAQVGSYMKINALVIVTVNIQTSAFTHTTASGNLHVTGLPFTSRNVTNDNKFGSGQWEGITRAAGSFTDISARIAPNDNKMLFVGSASGGITGNPPVVAADMPTGGSVSLRFTVAFEAA